MIPMQQDLKDNLQFLVGNQEILDGIGAYASVGPFSDDAVDFLDALSRSLREDGEAKGYSDVLTFAFWCRRASVLSMKGHYEGLESRIGRGVTFHVSPSNIPLMFAFSFAASLLAGNANVIRISSQPFAQTDIVCRVMGDVLDRFPRIKQSVAIVRYPHDRAMNDYFSALCDSRIIWGGDHSIREIRKSELPSHAIELPFYDRLSFALIESKRYLQHGNKRDLARKFYNDTYFTDQNACSSPQLVIWSKEGAGEAREVFWRELGRLVDDAYPFQSIQGVDKLSATDRYAIRYGDAKMLCESRNLVRMEISELHDDLRQYRCPGGYFYEYVMDDLDEIQGVCTRDCQTIAYFGFERDEIEGIVKAHGVGGDRIVPIGETMDFGLQWDGFDFIYSLSRIIG